MNSQNATLPVVPCNISVSANIFIRVNALLLLKMCNLCKISIMNIEKN